ncbi:unnamed protein product [Didymodactylos carnosus]|uniref:NR LBD domain-containing protein n=1 Tax=Didymodactylos carnosus TaxID=1234261 RepID=A0A814AR25_9BILA|nr:unnamed protein product [Didymodactylos carnosus]CAF3695939.1 unnamed protein product [Didymodactylos carnosus]
MTIVVRGMNNETYGNPYFYSQPYNEILSPYLTHNYVSLTNSSSIINDYVNNSVSLVAETANPNSFNSVYSSLSHYKSTASENHEPTVISDTTHYSNTNGKQASNDNSSLPFHATSVHNRISLTSPTSYEKNYATTTLPFSYDPLFDMKFKLCNREEKQQSPEKVPSNQLCAVFVRTDLLKGRRGRLPSKLKSPHTKLHPNSLQTQIIRIYNDSIPSTTCLDYSTYQPVISKANLCEEKRIVYEALLQSCEIIKEWCDKFCLFYLINLTECHRLLSNSLFDLIVLRTAIGINENHDRVILLSGVVLHKVQLNCLLGDIAQQMYDFSLTLSNVKADNVINACLVSALLLAPNNQTCVHHASLPIPIADLYNKIIECLKEHLKQIYKNNLLYAEWPEEIFNKTRQIGANLKKRLLSHAQNIGSMDSVHSLVGEM